MSNGNHIPFSLRTLILSLLLSTGTAQAQVTAMRAPYDGFRPRAVLDGEGVLHVVQGNKSSRTDLVYVRQEPGSTEFSSPIPVNTTAGIVACFDMAVGEGGRVHVLMRTNPRYSKLWMPADQKVKFWDLKYMLYARLNDAGDGFEAERNLAGETIGFEGAGTILADGERVLAFWHGQLVPKFDEPSRRIYRALSTDGGRTFSEPEAVRSDVEGACQCCPLAGGWGEDGEVVLGLRNSTVEEDVRTKDSYVLVSQDLGRTFEGRLLDPWQEAGCPGSLGSVTSGPSGVFVAWRTRTAVHMANVEGGPWVSPTRGANTRTPVIVSNQRGDVLFLWGVLGGPKAKGAGHIAWQVFDGDGQPVSPRGWIRKGVAKGWGAPTAFAKPDGSFVILYDGEGE